MHRHISIRGIIAALVLLDNNTALNEHRSAIAAHFANAASFQGTSTLLRHTCRCIFPKIYASTKTAPA